MSRNRVIKLIVIWGDFAWKTFHKLIILNINRRARGDCILVKIVTNKINRLPL